MQQICTETGAPFEISEREQEYCSKHGVPLPKVAPFERLRNILIFRNRMHLSRMTCAHSGEQILSAIPPESGHVVYNSPIWESDAWDATAYGRPYDFTRPFFSQLYDLYRVVPMPNLG